MILERLMKPNPIFNKDVYSNNTQFIPIHKIIIGTSQMIKYATLCPLNLFFVKK